MHGNYGRVTGRGRGASPSSRAYGEMDLLSVVTHELGHVLGLDESNTGFMCELLAAGTRLAPSVSSSISHVFDETSGSFLSVNEMTQFRTLQNGLINLPTTNQLSDWIVRGLADDRAGHQNATFGLETAVNLLEHETSSSTSKSSVLSRRAIHSAEAGKLTGGLINWNKSFGGRSLSRLHSLL